MKAKTEQINEVDVVINEDSNISWFVFLANGQTLEVVEDDLNNTKSTNQMLSCTSENKSFKQQ